MILCITFSGVEVSLSNHEFMLMTDATATTAGGWFVGG